MANLSLHGATRLVSPSQKGQLTEGLLKIEVKKNDLASGEEVLIGDEICIWGLPLDLNEAIAKTITDYYEGADVADIKGK